VHPPLGRYYHATVHPLGDGLKRLVMVGQVGIKPDGTLAGDLAAQIEQVIAGLARPDLKVEIEGEAVAAG
jgi:enamine deaminase RidA (YjgF/YER057c/UK114 family)